MPGENLLVNNFWWKIFWKEFFWLKVWSFGVFDFLEPPTCETINRRREDCDTQLREAVYFMVRLTLFSCFPVALAKISDNGHISTLFFSYAKWAG